MKKFSLHDLLLIAALSAIGLAIKPIINPMIHLVSSSLRIPGGSLSGGFLMMWMALARVIINKPGTAIIFGLTQGIVVMLLGFFGSHGVFSIVSYTLPGVAVEIVAMVFKLPPPTPPINVGGSSHSINVGGKLPPHLWEGQGGGKDSVINVVEKPLSIIHYPLSIFSVLCLYCVVANMTGSLVVALVVMQLPFLPLMISVVCSLLSGMLGGYFALIVYRKLVKYEIIGGRG